MKEKFLWVLFSVAAKAVASLTLAVFVASLDGPLWLHCNCHLLFALSAGTFAFFPESTLSGSNSLKYYIHTVQVALIILTGRYEIISPFSCSLASL